MLQAATALILILAANTSFTGFPFLVSFVAEDSFLPRMLTVRGHRLVFSNGIIVLAAASIALLLATGAKVSALIPMYAIGVFTGFTMAGAGMVKHHLTHRDEHWRKSVAVNGMAAVVCASSWWCFAVAEFTQGGWVVVVVMPLIVYGLVRTNRQYRAEDVVLEEGAAIQACEARILRRHVVVILIDRIDLATARAIQYARSLTPDDLRAVHFNIDHPRAEALIERWQRLGLSRLPLDVIDCPDRRLARASLELAAELADGETEVSMLLPRRSYGKAWRRILHDQTADQIVEVVSQLSHVNATIVPFLVAPGIEQQMAARAGGRSPTAGPRPRPRRAVRAGPTPAQAADHRRHHSHRRAQLAHPDPDRRPGQDPAGPAVGRGPEPGVRAGGRQRARGDPGLPRSPVDQRDPERLAAGGRGHGRASTATSWPSSIPPTSSSRSPNPPMPSDRSGPVPSGPGPRPTGSGRPVAGAAPRAALAAVGARPWLIWVAAVVAPVATALVLIPGRGHLATADDALILIVVTVAVASAGNRGAAALCALVSAAAFDFFLTVPYQSFRIHRRVRPDHRVALRPGRTAGGRPGRTGPPAPARGRRGSARPRPHPRGGRADRRRGRIPST